MKFEVFIYDIITSWIIWIYFNIYFSHKPNKIKFEEKVRKALKIGNKFNNGQNQ